MAKEAKGKPKGNFGRKDHKYGVADIAKEFDVNEATMRGKLRNAGIEKDGGAYGWDSDKALDEAVKKIKAASPAPAAKAKPAAKKAVAKKAVKKAA